MIITTREFAKCKALATKRLFRRFPEWQPNPSSVSVTAAYKVCEQAVHDRASIAITSMDVEENSDQYSHFSVLRQFTGYIYRCWLLEYDTVLTAIK